MLAGVKRPDRRWIGALLATARSPDRLAFARPGGAFAHPHVWVDAAAEIVYDDKGRISAIRHHWRFDEGFSAYALQGLDADRDGKYSAEELEPLAKENVESLKDFDFFTFLTVGDYAAGFAAPTDYGLELMDDRLLLHFTLPLASPLLTRGTATLEVGDPEYYVAFSLPSIEAVRLVDAPATCRLIVRRGEEPDAAVAAALAEIGPDQRDLPPEMQALAAGTGSSASVNCGWAVFTAEHCRRRRHRHGRIDRAVRRPHRAPRRSPTSQSRRIAERCRPPCPRRQSAPPSSLSGSCADGPPGSARCKRNSTGI